MADVVEFGGTAPVKDPGVVPAGAKIDANGNVSVPTDQPKKEETKAGDRPDWLLEKFKTTEEQAKAYSELEKKFSATKKEEPAKLADKAKATDDPSKAVADAGFDFQALETEYAENGHLKPETYKALADKGIKEEFVDSYIEGRKAVGAQLVSGLIEIAGSEESVADTLEWAKGNVDAAQVAAYNRAIKSGDPVLTKAMFQTIHAQFAESGGVEPSLKGGGGGAGGDTTIQPFASRAQMTKAMGSKEYKDDPGFRKEVERRVAATDFSRLL